MIIEFKDIYTIYKLIPRNEHTSSWSYDYYYPIPYDAENWTAIARYLNRKAMGNSVLREQLYQICPFEESDDPFLDAISYYEQILAEKLKQSGFKIIYIKHDDQQRKLGISSAWMKDKGECRKGKGLSFFPEPGLFGAPWSRPSGLVVSQESTTDTESDRNIEKRNEQVLRMNQKFATRQRAEANEQKLVERGQSAALQNALNKKNETNKTINKPETDWIELNLYYADQHKTPVFHQPYEIIFADGSTLQGTLNNKGFARHDNVPKGKVTVIYKEDPAQKNELGKLREQLDNTLNKIVVQVANDAKYQKEANKDISNADLAAVYTGSFMMGGVDIVTDLWAFAQIIGQGLVKLELEYLDLMEDIFTGDIREIQRKFEKAKASGIGAYEGASEVSEALYLLGTDEETWEILTGFVEDYWEAISGVDLTRSAAPIVIEILIAIFSGGAGATLLASRLGTSAKLVDDATDIAQQIVKAKKALGHNITKKARTSQAVVVPIDNRIVTGKSTKPDWGSVKTASKYSNAKLIELDSKGQFRDKLGNLRTNAGPNAPDFKKWSEKGGTTKYDEATDTIVYGMPEMKTSKSGTLDIEVPYKSGPPDNQRYPDFSNHTTETVDIPNMRGVSEMDITPPDTGDFSKAWEKLSQGKGDDYMLEKYGIKRRVKGSRKGSWPDKSPRGFTWHHHGDQSTMQLIDHEIHKTFTHSGGASASR